MRKEPTIEEQIAIALNTIAEELAEIRRVLTDRFEPKAGQAAEDLDPIDDDEDYGDDEDDEDD